jgi:hypothetical protein
MITFPATSKAAPTHQSGGSDSVKMKKPRMAVIMKFDEVLIMETWVVEVPRASALVKRAHIWRESVYMLKKLWGRKGGHTTTLNIRFKPKNICVRVSVCKLSVRALPDFQMVSLKLGTHGSNNNLHNPRSAPQPQKPSN